MAQRSDLIEKIQQTPGQSAFLRVALLDIVKFSLRTSGIQAGVIRRFTECLDEALAEVSEHYETYALDKHIKFKTDIIKLPTGDGAAIVFPFEGLHDIYLFFAKRFLAAAHARNAAEPCAAFQEKEWCDCHYNFKVRAGLSAGLGIIYKDINRDYNVVGEVMNMAARVTGLADESQVLLSTDAFKDITTQLKDDPTFGSHLASHPEVLIKHDLKSPVHQYVDEGEPYLNNRQPSCIAGKREQVRLLDEGDIWDFVVEKVKTAQDRIRVVFLASRPPVPDEVLAAIADRLEHERDLEYEIALVHRPGDEMDMFQDNHDRLLKMLGRSGAEKRYRVYPLQTDNPICFDTIIIDGRDVGIGFTRIASSNKIQNAIAFENKPDIVEKFNDWFERYIMRKALGND